VLPTTQAQGADDAYIAFRYGWNLAQHGILSWNESGYRRTEGFSDPLWVIFSAFAALPGNKSQVYPIMALFSVALCALCLFGILYHIYRRFPDLRAVTGLVLACCTPVAWLYATNGLESGVFGMALALLAVLVLLPAEPVTRRSTAILFFLAVFIGWLRSDGFVYLLILLAAAWIAGSKSWKPIAAGLLVSLLVLLLWRQVTFGAWLPNTAVAKVGFSLQTRLLSGWTLFMLTMLISPLIVLFPLLGASGLLLLTKRTALAGIFIFLAWAGYYLYIGGDHYPERHLIGLLFLGAAFSAPLWVYARGWLRLALIAVVLLGLLITFQRGQGRYTYLTPKTNDPWVILGKAIAVDREYYGVMIARAAGKIPFYAGGDFIDPYGLNDAELAQIARPTFYPGHSAGDDRLAIKIAQSHLSGIYSLFTYPDQKLISDPFQISLWVDTRQPQDQAQSTPTQQQWQAALASDERFIWSIITKPFPASFFP
jgi:hypothetical protein